MKARIILFILALCFFSASYNNAYSFWIWSPKTGKWVNPKNAPKPTPKEQFEYAKGLYDINNYEEAKREFQKLVKAYPKSFEASESQFYLGDIEEKIGNIYEAFLAYQKVVDKYPFSERIQQIIEREYKIGEAFMEGEKRKVMGIPLPVDNPAIEIFSKVVENSTYGPYAPIAQYKLGILLKGLMRYYEAEDAFNKVIANYPNSQWAEAAKYQLAVTRAAQSRGPAYDQGAVREAERQFEDFVIEHPDTALSKQAEENIQALKEKQSENSFNIAKFYEKQKAFKAAAIYYREIIESNPASPWAAKASLRLKELEKKK